MLKCNFQSMKLFFSSNILRVGTGMIIISTGNGTTSVVELNHFSSAPASVSDPDSLESGSGSSILAESGSGSRLQKLIDSKGLKC